MESGVLNLNKPEGMSSARAVSFVRRATGLACGHMGTLDPLASGVLPVAVGNATRLFDYLLQKQKVYRALFAFGTETDTLDRAGRVTKSGGRVPAADEVAAALASFVGEYDQLPPAYSAKNVNGVRAYDLARQGKEVALAPKRVRVDSLELLGEEGDGVFAVRIVCGGGTYIRSLARDVAAACGTCGYMAALVRERSGPFALAESIPPDALTKENWRGFLLPPDAVLDLPRLEFAGAAAARLKNGVPVPCETADGAYKLYLDGAFYGVAQAADGRVRAKTKLV